MPRDLQRLRNGIIVTREFLVWLQQHLESQGGSRPGREPVFDCLRISPNESSGTNQAFWWQIDWCPPDPASHGLPELVGGHQIWFTRAARHTLRDRCLDLEHGQPCLRR